MAANDPIADIRLTRHIQPMIEFLIGFFYGGGAEGEEDSSPVESLLQATVLLIVVGLIVWAIVA